MASDGHRIRCLRVMTSQDGQQLPPEALQAEAGQALVTIMIMVMMMMETRVSVTIPGISLSYSGVIIHESKEH